MKIRIFRMLMAGIVCLAMGACQNEAQKKVDELVNTTSQQCPIVVPAKIVGATGDSIQIESVKYSGNTVKYKVLVGNNFNLEVLKQRDDIQELVAAALAANNDSQVMEQLQICRDAGAKVELCLVDANGEEFEIEIDPTAIK